MTRKRVDVGGARRMVMSAEEPSPTVMAGGIGSVNTSQYAVNGEASAETVRSTDKPAYRVPSMAEIAAVELNGLTVASTFSGCGGSSLGYRMAGFRLLWASEFVEAARDSYRANMSPHTILDGRDVRQVKAEEVLRACRLRKGQLDLLDGSPPCASFSTAGKRQAGWGQVKNYSDTRQRTDDLLFEFARLVRGILPRTFVAENVSGLVKGTAKGYFLAILKELKECGYRVTCRVLDARWLGVPQMRQRTIFVGVRNDLCLPDGPPVQPCHPSPLPWFYSVRDAIPWIVNVSCHNPDGSDRDRSSATACPSVCGGSKTRSRTDQFAVEVSEDTFGERRVYTDGPAPSVRANKQGHIGVTSVEPESSMDGLATGREWDNVNVGDQSDRYFQLVKPALDGSCPTVTAAGGNPGLASVCHPTQRRKFSIAELKRICAFPDDFVLTGSYAQRWERLGRAVPPVMMAHVARAVRDGVLRAADGLPPWDHDMAFMREALAHAEKLKKK